MGLVRVGRGQLVLVAAAVIAIALVPILFAYLQLGYHPDVEHTPEVTGEKAIEFLDRSVHGVAAETAGTYEWADSASMASTVRAALESDGERLETARVEEGVVYDFEFNDTAAIAWSEQHCDRGVGRQFGDCVVDDGVVLQERADESVLLAVGFDLRIVGASGEADLTLVVEVGG